MPSDREVFHNDAALIKGNCDRFPPLGEPNPGAAEFLIIHLDDNAAAIVRRVWKAMRDQHQLPSPILRDPGEVDCRGLIPAERVGAEHLVSAERIPCNPTGIGFVKWPTILSIREITISKFVGNESIVRYYINMTYIVCFDTGVHDGWHRPLVSHDWRRGGHDGRGLAVEPLDRDVAEAGAAASLGLQADPPWAFPGASDFVHYEPVESDRELLALVADLGGIPPTIGQIVCCVRPKKPPSFEGAWGLLSRPLTKE